jgi:hypothetical protein
MELRKENNQLFCFGLVSLNHTDANYTIFNTQIDIYSIAYEIEFGKLSLSFSKVLGKEKCAEKPKYI